MFKCEQCLNEIKVGEIFYTLNKNKFLVEYSNLWNSKIATSTGENPTITFCKQCYDKIKWEGK